LEIIRELNSKLAYYNRENRKLIKKEDTNLDRYYDKKNKDDIN
jgi:hypothetical protein